MSNLATAQIRFDHQHVTTLFHRYKPDTSPSQKEGLVRNICAALEIYARLEEEVFYPACEAAHIDPQITAKSVPEHNEMRRMIARLRGLEPGSREYDTAFMELMRDVMHHVADEETLLLPDAERAMSEEQLAELGKRMTKLRLELSSERAGEIASSFVQASSTKTKLMAGGAVLAGAYLLQKAVSRPRHDSGARAGW